MNTRRPGVNYHWKCRGIYNCSVTEKMLKIKKLICCTIFLLFVIYGWQVQAQSAEVWVFFRPDIPLHADTVNHLKNKTTENLIFCPVGKTSLSFLESRPPACAVVLGDAAQELALSMLWKVKILVTLLDQPATDKRVVFLNTKQPVAKQMQLLKTLRKNLETVWYPYASERFAPDAALEEAATSAGVTIKSSSLDNPRSLPAALRYLNLSSTAAILPPDPGIMNDAIIKAILLASFRSHTPLAGFSDGMVRQGAAFAYVLRPERLAEAISEKIAEMVNDQHALAPTSNFERWELILNATILEKFNLVIPEEVRREAKKVY